MAAFDSGQLASLWSLTEIFGSMCLILAILRRDEGDAATWSAGAEAPRDETCSQVGFRFGVKPLAVVLEHITLFPTTEVRDIGGH